MNMGYLVKIIGILLIVVLIIKPLLIFILLKAFRHSNRTSWISAISLAQISEFSLVIAAIGLALGHISALTFDITVITAILTIVLTSYIIKFDQQIYQFVSKLITPLEKITHKRGLEKLPREMKNQIILFGAHRMGLRVIESLKAKKYKVIVVNFNPDIIKRLIKQKVQ